MRVAGENTLDDELEELWRQPRVFLRRRFSRGARVHEVEMMSERRGLMSPSFRYRRDSRGILLENRPSDRDRHRNRHRLENDSVRFRHVCPIPSLPNAYPYHSSRRTVWCEEWNAIEKPSACWPGMRRETPKQPPKRPTVSQQLDKAPPATPATFSLTVTDGDVCRR